MRYFWKHSKLVHSGHLLALYFRNASRANLFVSSTFLWLFPLAQLAAGIRFVRLPRKGALIFQTSLLRFKFTTCFFFASPQFTFTYSGTGSSLERTLKKSQVIQACSISLMFQTLYFGWITWGKKPRFFAFVFHTLCSSPAGGKSCCLWFCYHNQGSRTKKKDHSTTLQGCDLPHRGADGYKVLAKRWLRQVLIYLSSGSSRTSEARARTR